MEIIFEIISEILGELYFEIAVALVPEHKFSKWQTWLLKALSIIVFAVSLFLIIFGICCICSGERLMAGIIMTAVGASIILVHIIILVFLLRKDKIHFSDNE
ncbi:MAG: hypothetical protein ACI4RP_00490 [Acutalibacteraceae bacterium]